MSFLQPSYWFTMQPPEVGGLLGTIVFIVFVVFFVLGIVGGIVVDRKDTDRLVKKIGNRVSTLLVVMGLLGIILFFFSFERIQLFGARFWYPIWIVATLVWAVILARYIRRDVPQMREHSVARQEREKYLPGRHAK